MDGENPNGYEDLKNNLEKIKSEYNQAKKILDNIKDFSDDFERLKIQLRDENDGVNTNFNILKLRRDEINNIKELSQNTLNEIGNNLEKVKTNIESMQAAYNVFSEIKGKITGRNDEIDGLLNTTKSLKDDVERIKTEAQQTLENIKNTFAAVEQKIQEIQNAYNEFLQIKGKIDDENTGLKAVFSIVQDLQQKSQSLFKEIQSFRDQAKDLLSDINKNKDETDKIKNIISENLKVAQDSREEISNIADLITDTGFANAFQKRSKALFWGYIIWGIVFLVAVIVLAIFLYSLFKNINGDIPELRVVIYRLSLTSPLLFLIGFSMRQYAKERDLHEKYVFKATTATVIRNHIKFLVETSGSYKNFSEFILTVFSTLYKVPYEETEGKDGRPESDEIKLSLTKELKTLITDDSIFERVLSIIFRK